MSPFRRHKSGFKISRNGWQSSSLARKRLARYMNSQAISVLLDIGAVKYPLPSHAQSETRPIKSIPNP